MKIGMITDSVGSLDFDAMLALAARLGLDAVEFACGNWSPAPHIDRVALLEDGGNRCDFLHRISEHGLVISALNCSGNPLHPGEEGRQHDRVTHETIRLAGLLGVERVVLMSGCPGAPGDAHPNWITVQWPAETRAILKYQWNEVLVPYWRDLVAFAAGHGVRRLCLELHGQQCVYNVRTLLALRDRVGEAVGANFDPSHLMWMGADPIAAIRALGNAIYHVHAKDTRVDPEIAGVEQPARDHHRRQLARAGVELRHLGLRPRRGLVGGIRDRAGRRRLRRRAVDRARGRHDVAGRGR